MWLTSDERSVLLYVAVEAADLLPQQIIYNS